MRANNAISNFVSYIKNYKKIVLNKNSSIVIICDYHNVDLSTKIKENLKQYYCAVQQFFVESKKDVQRSIKYLNSADIGLLFFNDAEYKISNVLGNELFAEYNHLLENNLKSTENRKYFVFNDIGSIFNALYSYPPEYYINLNQSLISELRCGEVSLEANSSKLTFDLSSSDPWTSAVGLDNSLYPAEIATFSPNLSGEIDFTGLVLSVLPFTQKYGIIKTPVTLIVDHSELIDFHCSNKALYDDLKFYFSYAEKNTKVCEIGIGTNRGLNKLYPINCIAQERYSGFHLGFGGETSSYGKNNSIHLDFIFDKSIIKVADKVVFKDDFCF